MMLPLTCPGQPREPHGAPHKLAPLADDVGPGGTVHVPALERHVRRLLQW